MARYVIWDGVSTIITPSGDVFTPEQWTDRYPAALLVPFVISGGAINGSLMTPYDIFKRNYEVSGCDFSGLAEGQEVLDAIEKFEDESAEKWRKQEEASAAEKDDLDIRLVEALEDLVVLNMPDVEA